MASLDTNVLVRYLLSDTDNEPQSALAIKLIRSAVQAGDTLYIPITVMLELEWVLRSNFKLSKTQVTATLSNLLACSELSFESEAALEVALALYIKGGADFADCTHIALAHVAGESPLWTFDKAASKMDGAKLLV
jgi:predicted nucleic-acid-binding protein